LGMEGVGRKGGCEPIGGDFRGL